MLSDMYELMFTEVVYYLSELIDLIYARYTHIVQQTFV